MKATKICDVDKVEEFLFALPSQTVVANTFVHEEPLNLLQHCSSF